jgi:hypothetical protein
MELADLAVFVVLAAVVVLPLAREYGDLRTTVGLGRPAALATTALVFPAVVAGIAVSLPLASRPLLQWAAIVAVTVALYSLSARAIAASASSAVTTPSRRI